MIRLGILLSGRGRTFGNLLRHIHSGKLPARVAAVVSSRPDAAGYALARQRRLPAYALPRKAYGSDQAYGRAIERLLRKHRVDLVCMAGFLHFIPVTKRWKNRIMNIHPALLPAFGGEGFYGERVHETVLRSGAKVSGCTVHFADNVYDHGPIILQRTVRVQEEDTPKRLAERVFREECRAYPEAIRLYAEGRLRVNGRVVNILPAPRRHGRKSLTFAAHRRYDASTHSLRPFKERAQRVRSGQSHHGP